MYIKIKRKCCYLYHVIDTQGITLEIWIRRKRDT
ncbi:DDE-type integrase/transposase/recombinase [Lactococcus garvieae]